MKQLELKVCDKENENIIIKKFESTANTDFFSEKQRLGLDIKHLKDEIRRLEGESAKKDSEIHLLKINVEKMKIEHLDQNKEIRKLENDLTRMEDKLRERSPVMMKNETVFRKEHDENRNKKACLFELDQMVKQYRNDFTKQKYD